MAIGKDVFTTRKSDLKAVCINPIETKKENVEFSEKYYNSLINALEMQLGDKWPIIAEKCIKEQENK